MTETEHLEQTNELLAPCYWTLLFVTLLSQSILIPHPNPIIYICPSKDECSRTFFSRAWFQALVGGLKLQMPSMISPPVPPAVGLAFPGSWVACLWASFRPSSLLSWPSFTFTSSLSSTVDFVLPWTSLGWRWPQRGQWRWIVEPGLQPTLISG